MTTASCDFQDNLYPLIVNKFSFLQIIKNSYICKSIDLKIVECRVEIHFYDLLYLSKSIGLKLKT